MAEPAVRRTPAGGTEQSIGDLVSVAARDISQLVRYELDLAKIELKADVKRLGIGGALLAIGGFVLCLVLILLCFAFAYGLNALHIWLWASFLIVAGTCVLLTGLAALIGITMVRKMNGMSKTRSSVAEGLSMLRHRRSAAAKPAAAKASGGGAKAQARAG
jgi:protein-S-isoprenylcysteine O-methyltransferase Ste14